MVITAQDTKLKPGFKQTEVGLIPEDWEVVLLDSVAKRGSGHTPDKKHPEYWDGEIKWISLKDSDRLDNLYIDETAAKITPAGIANSSAVLHPAGTVVLSRDAGVGKSAITTDIMAVSQHFMAWQCGPRLNNHFLYYWLQAEKSEFERIAFGNTIKTIGLPYFKRLEIPLPTFDEQYAIATALSHVDALIISLDKLIAKKRDIKQATMQQLLTGKTRLPGFSGRGEAKLGDFFELNPRRSYLNETDLVTFIRMEDVSESGRIINQSIMPLSSIKKGLTYFERNDVLVAKITPCFENGKGACLDTLETKCGFGSTEFHVLRAKKNAVPRYIFYQTQLPEFRNRLEAEMIGTAGQKRVPAQTIIDYPLPIHHSKDEQLAISEILSDMDAEITALEQKRDKTNALKQGMMQELLTGKTRLI